MGLIEGWLSISGIDDGSDWNVKPAVGNDSMILLVNKTETPYIAHVMVKTKIWLTHFTKSGAAASNTSASSTSVEAPSANLSRQS
ncbi:hypothetical protein OA7_0022985 [Vibrio cyclitrophicus 1F53]|uniref:Uncharacterized protein n=1 Tax=Vibrio pomeroyi TaxID=198832 RepID=A0ABV4N3H7_9VIBR|nr:MULTISPECIES: hypothetical protein [Vibrio]OEF32084.1 hypothetical protein OA7_16230 [Vibrio cyclitrophicus 1F53]OEF67677.1 hypothetical protein OAA_04805 [Vibrio cyclitrophicus 1F175]UPR55368.1 hypothetical protein ITG10_08980 [Vibrio sp. ED004]